MIGRVAFGLAAAVLLAPHEPNLGLTPAAAIQSLDVGKSGNPLVGVADFQALVFQRLRGVRDDMENDRRRKLGTNSGGGREGGR